MARLLSLGLILAVSCGNSAVEKPRPAARSHAATGAVLYDVIDLSGDLGNGIPDRISDDGIITGTAHDSTSYFRFTYDTSSGAVTRYYPPDKSRESFIGRLLFNGDNCGYDFSGNQAYVQTAGVATDIGTLGGFRSSANDCNASGQAVGYANVPNSPLGHAFFWDGSTMTDLGSFGGEGGTAAAINSSGQATGGLETRQGYGNRTHAFFYDNNTGTLTDLGTLGYDPNNPNSVDKSSGKAINELGHIAGQTSTPAGEHGFLWDGQTMIDLGSPPPNGGQTEVLGMNDSDVVVGVYSDFSQRTTLAFAWLNGAITDLNTVAGPTDMVLWRATSVNNLGQIVGYGGTPYSGVERAFLLNPR